MLNSSFLPGLEVQSLCPSAPVGEQHGGVEKKTPIDPMPMGATYERVMNA